MSVCNSARSGWYSLWPEVVSCHFKSHSKVKPPGQWSDLWELHTETKGDAIFVTIKSTTIIYGRAIRFLYIVTTIVHSVAGLTLLSSKLETQLFPSCLPRHPLEIQSSWFNDSGKIIAVSQRAECIDGSGPDAVVQPPSILPPTRTLPPLDCWLTLRLTQLLAWPTHPRFQAMRGDFVCVCAHTGTPFACCVYVNHLMCHTAPLFTGAKWTRDKGLEYFAHTHTHKHAHARLHRLRGKTWEESAALWQL